MKKNKKYYEMLDKLTVDQLKKMIEQKKIEIEINKLNIVKKDLISRKLDIEING